MKDKRDDQEMNEKANKMAFRWFWWTVFTCFAFFAAVFTFII